MSDTNDNHIIGGHKAAIHNPNVSAEAKDHSKEVLKENFHSEHRKIPSFFPLPAFNSVTWC